jgi:DNA-binding NtrC family response regulator
VVDDDPMTRDFTVDVLAYSVNREVKSFGNGVDAWSYIKDPESADIIVSEVDMPQMDGLELLKRVKSEYPQKICILMSSQPAHETAARQSGADAFLAKPFDINDLFEIVQNFVVEGSWKPFDPSTEA